MIAAVTMDLVGSRRIADRAAAQREIDDALARVGRVGPKPITPLHPTVGDETQGVYAELDDALAAVLLLRLRLPDDVDCRFGIGLGAVGSIPSAAGDISEGPGWWAAREAIDTVHRLQQRAVPGARTWVAAADDASGLDLPHVNAYLLARDQLVTSMSERTRRLAYGRCLGTSQRDLAGAEGITQSAVSQALASAGAAAVVEGYRLLRHGS
ncbi:SatD family protein [Agromyces seonyuensis]|uniref:RNA polymerase subunit sigma-70 n=1 Tax=Agromyces seonyuensis TaxID=2662446 RepID=A0A6I4NXM3_9MICO|nr:SatD family protein [Agromyces seonyuensis]MWB98931.1 hypothetical protein [Agromyces seonyuensis]